MVKNIIRHFTAESVQSQLRIWKSVVNPHRGLFESQFNYFRQSFIYFPPLGSPSAPSIIRSYYTAKFCNSLHLFILWKISKLQSINEFRRVLQISLPFCLTSSSLSLSLSLGTILLVSRIDILETTFHTQRSHPFPFKIFNSKRVAGFGYLFIRPLACYRYCARPARFIAARSHSHPPAPRILCYVSGFHRTQRANINARVSRLSKLSVRVPSPFRPRAPTMTNSRSVSLSG